MIAAKYGDILKKNLVDIAKLACISCVEYFYFFCSKGLGGATRMSEYYLC